MSIELGHFALILAFAIASVSAVMPGRGTSSQALSPGPW